MSSSSGEDVSESCDNSTSGSSDDETETSLHLQVLSPKLEKTPNKKQKTHRLPPSQRFKASSSKASPSKPTKRKVAVRRKLDFDIDTNSESTEGVECGTHNCSENRSASGGGSGGGSSGKWLVKTVPKKGWRCVKIKDLEELAATCEMCEREKLRYVHTMLHPKFEKLKVGCICAGHMSGDSKLARERQSKLELRLKRRENFPELRNWKVSARGNPYIVFQRKGKRYWVVITKSGDRRSAIIEDKSCGGEKQFINKWCNTKNEAQLAAFDHLFPSALEFKEGEPEPDFDFGYHELK